MLAPPGLADRRRDLVETLSGGLRRRVELAKGMLHHPRLLLLDEPSTGLDPGTRSDLWDYLQQVRRDDGVTVVLTTHLLEEAEKADRIAILNKGSSWPRHAGGVAGHRGRRFDHDPNRRPEALARDIRNGSVARLTSSAERCGWNSLRDTSGSPDWSRRFAGRFKASRSASRRWRMCSSSARGIASGPSRRRCPLAEALIEPVAAAREPRSRSTSRIRWLAAAGRFAAASGCGSCGRRIA